MQFNLMNDYMFKKYFSMEKNLRRFLSLLGIHTEKDDIVIQNTEQKDSVFAKGTRFDVRVAIGNRVIDLEAQNQLKGGKEGHVRRQIHYASQIHSTSYEQGELYGKKRQSIIIFVNSFNIEGYDVITRTRLKNESTNEFYDDILLLDISLKKAENCANIELEELLIALSTKEYISFQTEMAQEAMQMIKDWNEDQKEIIQAQNILRSQLIENTMKDDARKEGLAEGRAEGLAIGLEEGRAEGRAEGLEDGKRAVALMMLKKNMTIEDIAECTGLSVLELNQMKSEMNQ